MLEPSSISVKATDISEDTGLWEEPDAREATHNVGNVDERLVNTLYARYKMSLL